MMGYRQIIFCFSLLIRKLTFFFLFAIKKRETNLCSIGLFECTNSNVPVIVEQPQDILAELDKPMALHCRAESSSLDDLHVNWYKDGKLVTMDPNARIITEFMALHVINTMPQDAGNYYCIAENPFGKAQSRTAKVQFISKSKKDFISFCH